jgi:hypothetical protein
VQIRRLTAATAAGLALAGLAGCRTAPNVAAYVGDDTVTVSELESAVDDRLEDPAIAESLGSDREAFTRQVLGNLVQDEVHEVAAERYGVEVSDDAVRDRLGDRLAQVFPGQDESDAFASLAAQGVSRADAFSVIRQELIRLGIAEEEGLDDPLSEDALRERYEQTVADSTSIPFGYITVPNQRAADQVVAALNADPDRYAELAERFAGDFTLAAVQEVTAEQIPGPLAEQAATAEPGTAFAVPVEQTGGIVVGFVGPTPSFEQLEPQLQGQAEAEVDQAAQPLVKEVRDDLDVVVNPRYGDVGDDGSIQLPEDGVVKILEG